MLNVLYWTKDKLAAMKTLHIEHLQDWQADVLSEVFAGEDLLLIQATGKGKSAIFQIPSIMEAGRGLTLVLSPQKALQKDQVSKLRECGVKAALLNSDLSKSERKTLLETLSQLSLLYLAPEQLGRTDLLQALERCTVMRVVVDEAHTIPQSEHAFRPAYGKIGAFIDGLGDRPQIIACTATATPLEQARIIQALGMIALKSFLYPIRRKNLHLITKKVDGETKEELHNNLRNAVLRALKKWDRKGAAIVYVPTVDGAEQLYRYLSSMGWNASIYTGPTAEGARAKTLKAFRDRSCNLVVATSAFGLGIDRPDVRLVIHMGLPLTMQDYVQAIGRGGRDGKDARCMLFYTSRDCDRNMHILKQSGHSESTARNIASLKALYRLIRSHECLWQGIERYYGERPKKRCNTCSNCLQS